MSSRARTTLVLVTAFVAYFVIALRLDAEGTAEAQAAIGLTTWAFLVAALRFSPWEERLQVVTMVVVATTVEVLCSVVLGVYTYRLDNLPSYVPPGHGLFYLMALRLSQLGLLRRHVRAIAWSVLVGATALLFRNLMVPAEPDLFGLATWIVFIPFIARSRLALLYGVSFVMTMVLEFYGTGLGTWTWASTVPFVGLAAANPPACIGAGYCIMDAATRWLAPKVQALWTVGVARYRRRGPSSASGR